MRVVLENTDVVNAVDRTAKMSDSLTGSVNELLPALGRLPVTRAAKLHKLRVNRSRRDRNNEREPGPDSSEIAESEEEPGRILIASDADVEEECETTLIDVQASADVPDEGDTLPDVLNVRS